MNKEDLLELENILEKIKDAMDVMDQIIAKIEDCIEEELND